jgi:hypothetical protein
MSLGNNLGTIAPEHQGRTGAGPDQQARRDNKLANPALSAKPPSPVQIRAAPPKFARKFLTRSARRVLGWVTVTELSRRRAMQVKDALTLAKKFLASVQVTAVSTRTAEAESESYSLNTWPHFWFMRDGVSVGLEESERFGYVLLVDALHSAIGPARRSHVTRKTIETLVQRAIVEATRDSRKADATVDAALKNLRRELHAPASEWEVCWGVAGLNPPRRRRQFGRVALQALTPASLRAVWGWSSTRARRSRLRHATWA